jgi:hypothetical protein
VWSPFKLRDGRPPFKIRSGRKPDAHLPYGFRYDLDALDPAHYPTTLHGHGPRRHTMRHTRSAARVLRVARVLVV